MGMRGRRRWGRSIWGMARRRGVAALAGAQGAGAGGARAVARRGHMGEGDDDVGRATAQRTRNGGVGIGIGADRQAGCEALKEAVGAVGGADEPGAGGGDMPGGQAQAQGGAGVAEEVGEEGQDESLDRLMQARVGTLGKCRGCDKQAGGGLGDGWWN